MKAFLGMGLLGSGFVRAMINRGDKLQVWNRTESKATELEQFGAKAFTHAADAVSGAGIIHLALKDDDSVDEVLEAARPGLAQGAIIIDHTTTSKEGAIRRTREWKERGFFFQHAPVFMGPANALEGSGFMLVSGDQDLVSRIEPELSKMTGKLLNFGTEAGRAAAIKLVGNTLNVCFTIGIRDSLSLAKALDVPVTDLSALFNVWNPAIHLPARSKKMIEGDYNSPSWELNMARKDTALILEAAAKGGKELALIPGAAAVMDQWIENGYGDHDWTVVAKDSI